MNGGSLTASYATGRADGGDGNSDVVGGLVGWMASGRQPHRQLRPGYRSWREWYR